MKTIAISNTINGVKTVVDTEATTLGELKQFMAENNISYPTDALWYSGLTKSRLEFDNSEFISDSPRTCNIDGTEKQVYGVVLIVPSKNKIESGAMTRSELYMYIHENNLKDEIKEVFGKPYTNVPTDDLYEFINHYDDEPAEDMENHNCDCNSSTEDKPHFETPLDLLKFASHLLNHAIEIVEGCDGNCNEEVEDDLDKMVKDIMQYMQ